MRRMVKLAFSYLRFYKAQTLALFLGIVMSAALLTGIASLLYSGQQADMERTRQIYGDWHFRFRLDEGETDDYAGHMQEDGFSIEKYGMATVKKVVEEPFEVTFIYGDENYMEMLGRGLIRGRYPEKPGEAALDLRTIRNLELDDTIGQKVKIDGEELTLCGIVEEPWETAGDDMQIFVSRDAEYERETSLLFVKFDEAEAVFSQLRAFAGFYGYDWHDSARNNELAKYVGGFPAQNPVTIIKNGMELQAGRLGFIWGSMNDAFHLSEKLILAALGLFGAFVIYSLFQISLQKRLSQYSVMQVLGMDEHTTFAILWMELFMIFLVGYPAGALLGNGAAGLLYSRIGKIFVDQSIGQMQSGVHAVNMAEIAEHIDVQAGGFCVSYAAAAGGALFLSILLVLISILMVRRMRKFTWTEMITRQKRGRRSRRIYSRKTENMTGVLAKKFIFERKAAFFGTIVSLAAGSLIFVGTAYVAQNTQTHNELVFKADDGLGSDIQVYEDSDSLIHVIPERTAERLSEIPGIKETDPVKYTLGEVPFLHGEFLWPEYFAETAGEENFEPEEDIMEKYNGRIVKAGKDAYRMKVNVYGYTDAMLEGLSDYLLEGAIDPKAMEAQDSVILKTLVDGQGYYDGIAVKPGDTIRLKVPKYADVPEEALRFLGPDDWYIEKEFRVAALVSRSLGKNDYYIGDDGETTVGIIMSNAQMEADLGIKDYNSVGIHLKDGADSGTVSDAVRKETSGIPDCLVKDYTQIISQQNLYLQQKTFFLYGIALILLLISLLNIVNSMQYLVVSRRHEFGILRAMGITDAGFMRMLIKEGVRYGLYAGIFMILCYIPVHRVLYYAMVHIFRYLHPEGNLPIVPLGLMLILNLCICTGVMLYAGRSVLKEDIIATLSQKV